MVATFILMKPIGSAAIVGTTMLAGTMNGIVIPRLCGGLGKTNRIGMMSLMSGTAHGTMLSGRHPITLRPRRPLLMTLLVHLLPRMLRNFEARARAKARRANRLLVMAVACVARSFMVLVIAL